MSENLKDGEPWEIKHGEATTITCCDCGLLHKMFVDIKGKKLTLRFFRDTWETKKKREKDKIVIYRRKEKGKKK